jgi:hypothetical protein
MSYKPAELLGIVCQRWGKENTLHWTLDVVLDEDLARSRKDNAPDLDVFDATRAQNSGSRIRSENVCYRKQNAERDCCTIDRSRFLNVLL